MNYLIVLVLIVSLISLVLSIIALTKKDKFSSILSPDDCKNQEHMNKEECIRIMSKLSTNIGTKYSGLVANRGLHESGVYGGTFGDPNVINP